MKAIAYTQCGPPDVLHLKDVDKPTPNDDHVHIKVHGATIQSFRRCTFAPLGAAVLDCCSPIPTHALSMRVTTDYGLWAMDYGLWTTAEK